MNREIIEKVSNDIYETKNLSLLILNQEDKILHFPNGFTTSCSSDFETSLLLKNSNIQIYLSTSRMYFILPSTIETKIKILIGPIALKSSESNRLLPKLSENSFSTIKFLYKFISDTTIHLSDLRDVLYNNNKIEAANQITSLIIKKRDYENYVEGYRQEVNFLHQISLGNSLAARLNLSNLFSTTTESLSDEDLTDVKYRFVALITLITRTVISAGVEPEQAYSTSDVYIRGLYKLYSIDDILEQSSRAIISFCLLVNQVNKKNLPHWVQQCKAYINQNLHNSITLDDISNFVHLSRNYLSVQFKKETGTSLSYFINQQRMSEAEFLIKQSTYSLLEISEMLNFKSQSYFSKTYRIHKGIRPSDVSR